MIRLFSAIELKSAMKKRIRLTTDNISFIKRCCQIQSILDELINDNVLIMGGGESYTLHARNM